MQEPSQRRQTDQRSSETDRQASRDVQNQADTAASRIREEVGGQVENAKSTLVDRAEREKGHLAGSLSQTADALKNSADNLDENSTPRQLLSEAASGLRSIADEMEGKSVGELANSLSQFARRNPAAFLGGAALAGFAISRFAKASRDDQTGSGTPQARESTTARQTATPTSTSPETSAGATTSGA
ncbi:MAG: hypothetical protein WD767_16210 [Alphaproteobacteria bacterium]